MKGPCPQASGYELANQDEMSPAAGNDDDEALVEETLEDEDDFEVSAATMTGHGRENQSLMRLRSSSLSTFQKEQNISIGMLRK